MVKSIERFLVSEKITVKEAMRQMGKAGERILFVVDGGKRLKGSLTDGDIRRFVLKEGTLSTAIGKVYNRKPFCVEQDYSVKEVKKMMLAQRITWIPVVDKEKKVCDVLLWDDVLGNGHFIPKGKIDLPVVIMAGGKGTRLDPFTRILPKPLIPIGEKAIIEVIMDKFNLYAVNQFYISVHHKSRMIKAYFDEKNTSYDLRYIEEEEPLGTAGSLKFLEGAVANDLIVTNCDIIIDSDYLEIVKFHQASDNDITIVGSFRHFTIPYGICSIEDGGRLTGIQEKPEYDFLVNTGMYLLKKETLSLIPKRKFYNITDLVNKVKDKGGKVGVFPISEKSWIDVGQWEEYQKSLESLTIK